MTKWLGPLAYFGAVFGVEGEAQPGVMSLVSSGLGGCSVSPKGSARGAMSALGSSAFQGTIEAAQQAQTVDIGMIASGSGSVAATLSTVVPAVPSEFSGRAFWRPASTPVESRRPKDAELAAQGGGAVFASPRAVASLGMVASGSGAASVTASLSESDEVGLDELALILALAA